MQITLTPELELIVKRKLDEGYTDPVQVVGEALHGMYDDDFPGWDKDVLKEEVRKGFEQLKQGKFGTLTVDDIVARLKTAERSQL